MPGTNKPCPITGTVECLSRQCELHYTDAPLRLAPDACPVCGASAITMPHTPMGPDWCVDLFAELRGLTF